VVTFDYVLDALIIISISASFIIIDNSVLHCAFIFGLFEFNSAHSFSSSADNPLNGFCTFALSSFVLISFITALYISWSCFNFTSNAVLSSSVKFCLYSFLFSFNLSNFYFISGNSSSIASTISCNLFLHFGIGIHIPHVCAILALFFVISFSN